MSAIRTVGSNMETYYHGVPTYIWHEFVSACLLSFPPKFAARFHGILMRPMSVRSGGQTPVASCL